MIPRISSVFSSGTSFAGRQLAKGIRGLTPTDLTVTSVIQSRGIFYSGTTPPVHNLERHGIFLLEHHDLTSKMKKDLMVIQKIAERTLRAEFNTTSNHSSKITDPEFSKEIFDKVDQEELDREEYGPNATEIEEYLEGIRHHTTTSNSVNEKEMRKQHAEHIRQVVSLHHSQINSNNGAKRMINKIFCTPPSTPENDLNSPFFSLKNRPASEIQNQNKEKLARSNEFREDLKNILSGSDDDAKITLLQDFIYHRERNSGPNPITGITRFNSLELKIVFSKLWELNAFDQIVEMMDNCENKHFTNDPHNIAIYARALLRSHYMNHYNVEELANFLIDNPETHVEGMIIKGMLFERSKFAAKELIDEGDNEKTRKNYLASFPKGEIARDPQENYRKSLDEALKYYQEAFFESKNCRIGRLAMDCLIEKGLIEEAKEMALLVKLAAQKEGGVSSSNVAVARAYLETLYILPESDPKEIEFAQKVVYSLCKKESQILNVLGGILHLAQINPNKGGEHDEKMKNFSKDLANQYFTLSNDPQEFKERIKRVRSEIETENHHWIEDTFNYKGISSNHIEGNFRFGAQLYDHSINHFDRQFFEKILDTPLTSLMEGHNLPSGFEHIKTLRDIETIEQFNAFVDPYIRQKFHTDSLKLEDLTSDGHKVFDKTMLGLISVCGASTPDERRKITDSRTSISMSLTLGLGDCRHHAQAKQLLFDVWHTQKLDQLLTDIHKAKEEGNPEQVKALTEAFNQFDTKQINTADIEIWLPIELSPQGQPLRNPDGKFIMNSTRNQVKVEEHTLNVELETDLENNELKKVKLCDSFYHDTFPWADCEIPINQTSGRQTITAGSIEVYNPSTNQNELIPVSIKRTAYAGTRDLYDSTNRYLFLMGQPVAPSSIENFTPDEQKEFLDKLYNI